MVRVEVARTENRTKSEAFASTGRSGKNVWVNFGTWLRAGWVGQGLFVNHDASRSPRTNEMSSRGVGGNVEQEACWQSDESARFFFSFLSPKVDYVVSKPGLWVLQGGMGDRRFISFVSISTTTLRGHFWDFAPNFSCSSHRTTLRGMPVSYGTF